VVLFVHVYLVDLVFENGVMNSHAVNDQMVINDIAALATGQAL